MSRKRYDREFKLSAVKLVTEQGYTVAQASKSLGVTAQSIRDWREQMAPNAVNYGAAVERFRSRFSQKKRAPVR